MKKNIKYKAIAVHSGEWMYGSFIFNGYSHMIFDITSGNMRNVIPETVCRFATNVNGIDIYENDKLQDENGHIGIVVFENNEQHIGFIINWDDGDICWCFNDAAHPFFEVVENIFDDKITGV